MKALDRTRPPEPSGMRSFEFPSAHRFRLANGMAVLSARHGRLPVVTAQLVVDAGAAREDLVKAGLAHLTAQALDTGTTTRSGEALAWEFERIGVELDAEAGWDAILVQVTAPSARVEPAVALLADVVRNACFPEPEIERLRDEQIAEILQRQKEPRALANDTAAEFIFGPDALYGRSLLGSEGYVRELRREDVVAFHRAFFGPATASLVLVGDIDEERARTLAERHFGDWTSAPSAATTTASSPPAARGTTVYVIDRPDAVQSEIRVGHVAVARDHEDYFPLIVLNTLLGGAFTSRLNLSLRERHGFTYGVKSAFGFRRAPGPFVIQTAVATDVTARAVEEILRELRAIREDGVTEDEVENARRYLSGVIPLELQTTEQLAGRLADLVIFDLPDDYFDAYAARIAAVTRADVDRVARERIQPDRLAIVIVGNAGALEELHSFAWGSVEWRR